MVTAQSVNPGSPGAGPVDPDDLKAATLLIEIVRDTASPTRQELDALGSPWGVWAKAAAKRPADKRADYLKGLVDAHKPTEQARIRQALAAAEQLPPGNLDDDLPVESWPDPAHPDAFHGLLGEFSKAVGETTEADVHAVLVHALLAFGSLVGRGPHAKVGEARHGTNDFALIVGPTGSGRKGTAWRSVRPILDEVDPIWGMNHIQTGLSSGEGLKWKIRDEVKAFDRKANDMVVVDPGVTDKRLLLIEEEFAEVIIAAGREGNTLNTTLRASWDSTRLGAMTRRDPLEVTDPHVSLIAHITVEELQARLAKVDITNGLINRFLFCLARRSRSLPFGGKLPDQKRQGFVTNIRKAADAARTAGELGWTPAGHAAYEAAYEPLNESRPGAWGKSTDRQAPHVLRLAVIFALADCRTKIDAPHVRAAMAVVGYSTRSAEIVFGTSTGSHHADRILDALRGTPGGLTRREINDTVFSRNLTAADIGQALALLLRFRLVRNEKTTSTTGKGRPADKWFAS